MHLNALHENALFLPKIFWKFSDYTPYPSAPYSKFLDPPLSEIHPLPLHSTPQLLPLKNFLLAP